MNDALAPHAENPVPHGGDHHGDRPHGQGKHPHHHAHHLHHGHDHAHHAAAPQSASGSFSLIALSAPARLALTLPLIALLWLLTVWALAHG